MRRFPLLGVALLGLLFLVSGCGSMTGDGTGSTMTSEGTTSTSNSVALPGISTATLDEMGIRLTAPANSSPTVSEQGAVAAARKLFDHKPLGSVLATCTFFDTTGAHKGKTEQCWALNIDPSGDVEVPSVAAISPDAAPTSDTTEPTAVHLELVFIDAGTGELIKGIGG